MSEAEHWESSGGPQHRWWRLAAPLALLIAGGLLAVGLPDDDASGDGADLTVEETTAPPIDDASAERLEGTEEPGDDRPTPGPTLETPPQTAGALFLARSDRLTRVDLETGDSVEIHLDADLPADGGPPRLFDTGAHVVVARGDRTPIALPADLDGPAVELTGASEPADADAPAGTPATAVWTEQGYHDGDERILLQVRSQGGRAQELRRISLGDGALLERQELPAASRVVDARGDEVVLGVAGEVFRYDTATGEGERVGIGEPVAADDERVLVTRCRSDLSCHLVIYARDGEGSRVLTELPESAANTVHSAKPSPQGRWLALSYAGDDGDLRLGAVDLTSGNIVEMPATEATPTGARPGSPGAAWTPSGGWFVYNAGTSVQAWRPADGQVVELDVDGRGVVSLATGG